MHIFRSRFFNADSMGAPIPQVIIIPNNLECHKVAALALLSILQKTATYKTPGKPDALLDLPHVLRRRKTNPWLRGFKVHLAGVLGCWGVVSNLAKASALPISKTVYFLKRGCSNRTKGTRFCPGVQTYNQAHTGKSIFIPVNVCRQIVSVR